MSDPVDLQFHRFEKLSSSYAEALRQQLESIRSTDISKLNGRELRKLRDRVLNIKWLLVVCDPKTRDEVASRMGDLPPGAKLEEIAAYVPVPPTVKFF
jgi:hypothetical protein